MSVKIRMTRMGRRHRPFYRINAIDSRAPRDGRILEKLGHYDPLVKDPEKQLVLDVERVKYWLSKGAIPSDTVSEMLLRLGVKHKYAEQKAARRDKARALAKAKGRFFTKADRIAAQKAADAEEEKAKAEAEAKAKPPEPEPKPEEPKPEEPKAEEKAPVVEEKPEPKPEEPKVEEKAPLVEEKPEPKPEEPKPEEPKAEEKTPVVEEKPEPKPEEPKAEEPKAEEKAPVVEEKPEPKPDES